MTAGLPPGQAPQRAAAAGTAEDLRAAGGETLWPAPAKLNLFLHVTGRRPDGYHELQTVFQLIDLCDTIGITVLTDGGIERALGLPDVPPESDLAVRAARALQVATGTRLGARLRILKRIPQGGGLGGGSSDAATVLLALNELWGCGLTVDALARLGLPLGADVPVFVRGRSAWAEGVGERLIPVELPPAWYAVIHPGIAVATREIFQAPELTRNSPLITIRAFFEPGGAGPRVVNDCEPVVRARHAEVAAALDWLGRHAPARLTGTGSCLFAAVGTALEAERIVAATPPRWRGFAARGLNLSPVHQRLAAATA